ncbi:L-threonylcarbamoyladenylate synthase [soil metagenome]
MPRRDVLTTDVGRAATALRTGGLVAMPTETVYGLGADAEDEVAVRRIFEVKGRPVGHPLIVHVRLEDVASWVADLPPAANALAAVCWPGPLTLLLRRSARVSDVVTGGRDTVGLRVPGHPVAQQLLERVGTGIAAPSANRFGRVSPTTAQHVLDDLGPFLDPARDVVLDGGPSPVGVESTIVDCTTDPPQLLRPGGIPTEDVERILDHALAPAAGEVRAAGMLAAHYSPHAEVVLVDDTRVADERAVELVAAGRRVSVLDLSDDLVAYAHELYARLRLADAEGHDVVVAVLPRPAGLGHAIRDRLMKAAAGSPRTFRSPVTTENA